MKKFILLLIVFFTATNVGLSQELCKYTPGTFTVNDISACSKVFSYWGGVSQSPWSVSSSSWDYGDGTSTNGSIGSAVYNLDGTYNVCQTVTLTDGMGNTCVQQFCNPVTIVGCSPACQYTPGNFIVNDVSACSKVFSYWGGVAQFPWSVSSTSWDYGDGNTSNSTFGVNTYGQDGIYNVCQTVTLIDGMGNTCIQQFCNPVTVVGCTPTCQYSPGTFNVIAPPNNPCRKGFFYIGAVVQSPWSVSSTSWDFGDGNTSNSTFGLNNYSQDGTYNVCQTVTLVDGMGNTCVQQFCNSVTVVGCTPTCQYTPGTFIINDVSACSKVFSYWGGVAQFPWSVSSVSWDFGDGNTSNNTIGVNSYVQDGTYNVCQTVTLVDGMGNTCVQQFCNPITVVGCTPTCQYTPGTFQVFTFPKNLCRKGFRFNGSSPQAPWSVSSISWDYGDGNTSSNTLGLNTFSQDGTYNVCQTVTLVDGMGNTCVQQFCNPVTITGCGMIGPSGPINPGKETKTRKSENLSENFSLDKLMSINVFPNPASDVVNFVVEGAEALNGKIEIFNIQGKVILSKETEGESKISIDVSKLSKGIFLYRYLDNEFVSNSKRLIIK